MVYIFCVSSRRRHTRCALVTGVQTCALPISYTGTGLYEGKGKVEDLRLIATLYPETIHIVARKDAGIESVADLRGKRVSLDEPGSGTIVDARIVLAAYGLTADDVAADSLKPGPAGDRPRSGAPGNRPHRAARTRVSGTVALEGRRYITKKPTQVNN